MSQTQRIATLIRICDGYWLMKAYCVKTGPGQNNCTCRSGFVGDGTYCYPSTPCLNDSLCDVNAVCLPSTPGQVNAILNHDTLTLLSWPSKVGLKCPSVRPSVYKTFFSISIKFGMYVEVDEWCTTACSMTRSKVKVKVTSLWKLEILPYSKAISSAIYNGS